MTDSLGQVPHCQCLTPSLAPREGRSSQGTKLLLSQRAGEEATLVSFHTVCGRFSHWGAGSCFQQPMHCSAYAFDNPYLLLNISLAEMPGLCCNYLPKPFRCSFPAC